MRWALGTVALAAVVAGGGLAVVAVADLLAGGEPLVRAGIAAPAVVAWLALCRPLVERRAHGPR